VKNSVSSSQQDLDELWAEIEGNGPLEDWTTQFDLAVEADDWSERSRSQSDRRRTFIAFYGWAVPSKGAIAAISEFIGNRRLLEVCAGSGLWARLLAASGVRVTATDARPAKPTDYFPVETLDAEQAVRIHPECQALLLCWPPLRDACAFRALRAFAGDQVVLVGDARFTADQQFHDQLGHEWTLQESMAVPAWPGLDDHAYRYVRK
jgi:hypothetical protein